MYCLCRCATPILFVFFTFTMMQRTFLSTVRAAAAATASSAPAALVGRTALLSTSTAASQLSSSLRMSVLPLARTQLVFSAVQDQSMQRALNFCTTTPKTEDDEATADDASDDDVVAEAAATDDDVVAEAAATDDDVVAEAAATDDAEEGASDDVSDANVDEVAETEPSSGEEEIISVDMHTRYIGRVKWFRGDLGYGFVTADFGGVKKDIFVHYSQIRGEKMRGFRALWEDLEIEFQIDEDSQERMHCRKVSLPGGEGVPEPPEEEMERIEQMRERRMRQEQGGGDQGGSY